MELDGVERPDAARDALDGRVGAEDELRRDVLLREDVPRRRLLAVLEEGLDDRLVDEELQREMPVREELEAAHAARALLHARAVDGHHLLRAVVGERRALETVSERDRDRLRRAEREIEQRLRAVAELRAHARRLLRVDVDGALRDAQRARVKALAEEFGKEFDASYAGIVEGVYRSVSPSAYLGSIAPFVVRHASDPYVRSLLLGNFRSFIERVLLQYDTASYPVGIVGGFAWACRDWLLPLLEQNGIRVSKIIEAPIEGLCEYHLGKR